MKRALAILIILCMLLTGTVTLAERGGGGGTRFRSERQSEGRRSRSSSRTRTRNSSRSSIRAHQSGNNTVDTGDETAVDTGDDTAADTGDDTAVDTGDDTAADTGDDTAADTAADTGDDAAADAAEGGDAQEAGQTDDPESAQENGQRALFGSRSEDAGEDGSEVPATSKVAPEVIQEGTEPRKVRLAIFSDIHYVPDTSGLSEAGQANVESVSNTEARLLTEIDSLLSAALNEASDKNPDVLLVCGDMLSNGENAGAQTLSEKLKASRELEGLKNAGIYVVNGNHDINNSYAADFSGDTIEGAKRVQPSEFSTIFSGLGYGADDHCEGGSHSVYVPSDDPSVVTNHGGLSYAADVAEGVTLIVLDTATYRTDEDETTRYNEAQRTPGSVSDDLLNWAVEQAQAAKEKGNLVLAMSHHGLMPHYSTTEEEAAWYMDSFRIPNWEHVAGTLADAGVTAVLTGHSHANDIAYYTSSNNNVIYDIETAALCAYPCMWRTLDIEITGEGDEKSYTFTIDTEPVKAEDLPEGTDTSKWTFTLGNTVKTFDDDYGRDVQAYSYEKTGINETTVPRMAAYMIKNMLYDIVAHDGLEGFIREKLNIEEGQTFGDWATQKFQEVVAKLDGFSQDIDLSALDVGMCNLSMSKAEAESELTPTFDVVLRQVEDNVENQDPAEPETAKLTIDLTYLATAANQFVQRVQSALNEGDWQTNNYGTAPVLDDVQKLLVTGAMPALKKPLDPNNEKSSALELVNHAWQAFAAGDEAKLDQDQLEKERELLMGKTLNDELRGDLWDALMGVDGYNYPALFDLLEQPIAAEDKETITVVQADKPDGMLQAVGGLLSDVNTLNAAFSKVKMADFLVTISGAEFSVNLIPESLITAVQGKLRDLHKTMSFDENIPEDNKWAFRTVRFDANGGRVGQNSAVTVEDGKLVGLPMPDARRFHNFIGWFTEPEGGVLVGEGDDMNGIDTLYAQWEHIGRNSSDGAVAEAEKHGHSTAVKTVANAEEPVRDLHARLGSREALHATVTEVEVADAAHANFCKDLVERLAQGEDHVEMGRWISLDAQTVKAIADSGRAITLDCDVNGFRFRVVVPAGAFLQSLAHEDGSICVICLAEIYGWQEL